MQPELTVRRLAHRLGYRFRLHRNDLPGRPDLVFPGMHKVVFVHGCFWHSHGCKAAHIPRSNQSYWLPKLERNRARDQKNLEALSVAGWETLVVWECETREEANVINLLEAFLGRRRVESARTDI